MLTVTVNSPEKILWHGKADSVSSENSKGPFDVLSEHANFITIIEKKPIIIHIGKHVESFDAKRAVIYVQSDYVSCYMI